MAKIQKVTDPARVVTDPEMLRDLVRQGIDKDYVEFHEDYTTEHPSAKFYRDLKSGKQFMVISGLPKVEDTGRKIEVGWLFAEDKYSSKANQLSAIVNKRQVRVDFSPSAEGVVTWNPQIYLNGVGRSCGEATLLAADPDNGNYRNNVLEWDYGFCRRQLRLIHGAILERWIIASNPHGEVRISHNQSGALSLRLEGAVDAEGNDLEATVTEDEEIVPASSFDAAVYPVRISATLTAYSTSSDGGGYAGPDAVYADAHDNANSDTTRDNLEELKDTTNTLSGGNYYVGRCFLCFDTSALGAGATVSAATLSLYGSSGSGRPVEADADHSDLGIVEGIQGDPLDSADYGDHLTKTTLGADSYYVHPIATDGYNDKALNATGLGWISKTGTTKFCLRLKGDIDNATPTGQNEVWVYANEKGTGYQPKLVVTYSVAKTSADSGQGTEAGASLSSIYSRSETGTGSESLGSRFLGVAEEGGGTETLLARLLASTETASGLDFGGLFFVSSDVGLGSDVVLALEALLTGADSGSGIDTSFIIKALLSADSGLGTEAVAALLAGIVAGELMVGSDRLVVKIESAPMGGGMRLPPGGKTSIPSRRVSL